VLLGTLVEKVLLRLYFSVMQTTVVCGQLGSGKTTFIQNILRHANARTVVLVNDFGKLGIDGEIISSAGIDTIELPSGCVCCTLKFDLINTIQVIRQKYNPQELIIEPSGVATASGILEALELAGINQICVIGLIDTTEFLDLYESGAFGSFFEDQIRNSDIILLNKADLSSTDTVERTRRSVESINPSALVFETVRAVIDEPIQKNFNKRPIFRGEQNVALRLETISVGLKEITNRKMIEDFFNNISEGTFGEILRAKALFKTVEGDFRLDYAGGRVFLETFNKPVQNSRVVIIGSQLNKQKINKALGQTNLLL